jgi:hypothetical protein
MVAEVRITPVGEGRGEGMIELLSVHGLPSP